MSTSKATNGGKGSRKRKRQVSPETYSDNYDRIYAKALCKSDEIESMIAEMRKKGIADEAIELEIMKEYGERYQLAEIRELLI